MSLFKESRDALRGLYARALELQVFAWDAEREDLSLQADDVSKVLLKVLHEFDEAKKEWAAEIDKIARLLDEIENELDKVEKKRKEVQKPKVMIHGEELSPNLTPYEATLLRALLDLLNKGEEFTPAVLVFAAFGKDYGAPAVGGRRLSHNEYMKTGYMREVGRICGKYEAWLDGTTKDLVDDARTYKVFPLVKEKVGAPEALRHLLCQPEE